MSPPPSPPGDSPTPPATSDDWAFVSQSVSLFAIFTTDRDGIVTSWNAGAEKVFGFPSSEILGRSCEAVFTPEDCEAGVPQKEMESALRHGFAEDERWHCRKDGSRFFASGAMSPLWGPDRRHRGFTKICRDVTDKKLHEEELQRLAEEARIAREAAEDADRLKDEFLAGVSHELRTPLNAIIGWITLLKTEADDPQVVEEAIESIERNAQAQARLIEDILDIARITAGKLRLNPARVHVDEAVRAAEAAIGPAANSKGVQVEHQCEPLPELVADPERLQQVLCNLLHNAVKFTPTGGRVTTTIENGGTQAVITVADTGEGMDADILPHVFEPFRQGDGGSARRAAGVGLGLAITRHLVEAHGGVITASSDGLGKGSTFRIELPLPLALPKPEDFLRTGGSASGLESAVGSLQGVRLLVLDDDADARRLMSLFLKRAGAEVTVVSSVADALGVLAADHGFNAIVSDLGLPNEDGFAFIRRLRSMERGRGLQQVPAAALTAFARERDRAEAMAAGFDLFLAKPIQPAEVVVALQRLLNRQPSP